MGRMPRQTQQDSPPKQGGAFQMPDMTPVIPSALRRRYALHKKAEPLTTRCLGL